MPAPGTRPLKPALKPWSRPPSTSTPLPWAPLPTLDLSTFDDSTPAANTALAHALAAAATRWGFWVVTGAGIPQAQIDRQLAIAQAFFALPGGAKRAVRCDFSVGNNFGYHEPSRLVGNSNVKENMELLNIPKFTNDYASTPRHDFIRTFQDEISAFHRLVWDRVIRRLLVLFAIALELPEAYFVDRHRYEAPSEDHLRYMLYHPRPEEEDKEVGGQWIVGHTDFGSLTLLFPQNIAALQVRTPDNEWKWVKPIEGGITCNAADTLSFLTKGYIKSAIHRVVRPPADQAGLERLGLFYFARPGDDVPMVPAPSPVLRREGLLTVADEAEASEEKDAVRGIGTDAEYVRARVKAVLDRKVTRVAENTEETMFKVGNLAVRDLYL